MELHDSVNTAVKRQIHVLFIRPHKTEILVWRALQKFSLQNAIVAFSCHI
jgi:hypothetical protein